MLQMQQPNFTNLTASKHWLKAVHFTVQWSVITSVANSCSRRVVSSGNDSITSMTWWLSNSTARLLSIPFTPSGSTIRSIQTMSSFTSMTRINNKTSTPDASKTEPPFTHCTLTKILNLTQILPVYLVWVDRLYLSATITGALQN